jgi:hypothetical protein
MPHVFVDHDFLGPGDGAVGEEREMAVGEQVADDPTLRSLRDKQECVWVADQLNPGGVERKALGSERSSEVPSEGPDLFVIVDASRPD